MEHEMNFFDLCVSCARAVGRGIKAFGRLLAHMLRLTVHYWWIVLPILGLYVGYGYYATRSANVVYKVNAVALLNGASIQQFEQAYAPLKTGALLDDSDSISVYVHRGIASHFDTYRVVDAKRDGTADYIDFNRKSSAIDTVRVQMQDRLCLQFRIKTRDLSAIPSIECSLLQWLNNNDALKSSYVTYKSNLAERVAFNHAQTQKLDSLTSVYYFRSNWEQSSLKPVKGEYLPTLNSKVTLFLKDIYEQQEHLQQDDYRYQLATAPVTLENHFSVDPKPLNSRRQMMPKYCLIGWILGCMIAQLIHKRKAIYAWMKL